jgi:hypothetical protein
MFSTSSVLLFLTRTSQFSGRPKFPCFNARTAMFCSYKPPNHPTSRVVSSQGRNIAPAAYPFLLSLKHLHQYTMDSVPWQTAPYDQMSFEHTTGDGTAHNLANSYDWTHPYGQAVVNPTTTHHYTFDTATPDVPNLGMDKLQVQSYPPSLQATEPGVQLPACSSSDWKVNQNMTPPPTNLPPGNTPQTPPSPSQASSAARSNQ